MNKIGLILILVLNIPVLSASELDIVVVGLFSEQAVIEINKKQRLLKIGNTSPEGVTLISANSRGAILEINGEQKAYKLGSHIGTNYTSPAAQPVVSIWPTNGMYTTLGSINGFNIDFLVDTGASAIALNAATAKRIGLDYLNGRVTMVKTAASIEKAYRITLDQVQVGDIKLYNVKALVLEGDQPYPALLGMSFLGQLDMERKGDRMDLKKTF